MEVTTSPAAFTATLATAPTIDVYKRQMHVLSNSNYKMSGFIAQRVIPSFSDFVFLFMTISAFGMCCGYYERIMHNQLSLSHFYERRFRKILPFFGILVLLDLILEPSLSHLYEAFADLTLSLIHISVWITS